MRTARRVPPAALALLLIVLGAAALLWTQAVKVGGWAADEEYYVQLARLFADHFPGSLWDVAAVPDYNDRGLQRLTHWLLGWPLGVVDGERGFQLAHALLCLAWASAALPAYLMARRARVGAGWALGGALLTVLLPWSVLATSFLSESVAYPLALWALWGAARACAVPGARSDVLALGLVLLAGLARTNLLAFGVVAPVAVTVQALAAARGAGLRARGADAVRRLARDHPVLGAVAVLGVVALALQLVAGEQFGTVAGGYNTSLFDVGWRPLPEKFAGQTAPIVLGLGIVPVVLGLPWALAHAWRADAPETQGLALVAILGFVALLLSTVYAAPEERYLMLAAPPLLLCGIAALVHRDVPARAVLVAGVLVALLVDRVAWPYVSDLGLLQTETVRTTFSRIVVRKFEGLPIAPVHLVAVLIVAAAVVAAVGLRRPRWSRGAFAALTVLLVAVIAGQTAYAIDTRVATTGGATLAERSYLFQAAGGRPVAGFAEGQANSWEFVAAWRDAAFFNGNLRTFFGTGDRAEFPMPRYGAYHRLDRNETTGTLRALDGTPLPRLWVVSRLFPKEKLVAAPVARSAYLPFDLERTTGTPRLAWRWEGIDPDGWIGKRNAVVRLKTYPAARAAGARSCLAITLKAPPDYRGLHRFRVTTGAGFARSGAAREQQAVTVEVPLAAPKQWITVATEGTVPFAGGRDLSFAIAATEARRCRDGDPG